MSDQQTDINRGAHAERLMKDELLSEAFDSLEAEYLKAWKVTRYNDTDGRERLWQAIQVVGKVRTHLTSVANDGKLAQRELDDIAKRQQRIDA